MMAAVVNGLFGRWLKALDSKRVDADARKKAVARFEAACVAFERYTHEDHKQEMAYATAGLVGLFGENGDAAAREFLDHLREGSGYSNNPDSDYLDRKKAVRVATAA